MEGVVLGVLTCIIQSVLLDSVSLAVCFTGILCLFCSIALAQASYVQILLQLKICSEFCCYALGWCRAHLGHPVED